MVSSRSSLKPYAAKRRFDRTPEPKAGPAGRKSGNAFVIQKHAARRLHYDFRLELDGVLKSWAVTKGPNLDPAVRRLAVHVEDHPLAYGSFEGVIPAGEYGGGTVMLWDRGTWEPVGDARKSYAAGRLKFVLHGARLQGGWMLVRMKGRADERNRDNWLLIKERDEFARPGAGDGLIETAMDSVASGKTMDQIAHARGVKVWQSNKAAAKSSPAVQVKSAARQPSRAALGRTPGAEPGKLPDFVLPELAVLVEEPPDGDEWLHEIKIDGYRVYCRRTGGEVRLLTRTGQDWTGRFGTVADAVRRLPGGDFALDGEIAVFEEGGQSNFGLLQEALSEGRDDRLGFVVFDLLYLDGMDLREASLVERKRVLQSLLPANSARLRYSDHHRATGKEVFHQACQLALEGIVSKRAASPYRSGRGGDWVKAKCTARQEFVIGGYTEGTGARKGAIGALLLGWYEEEELHYAGRVGTGFSDEVARDLRARLGALKTARPAFAKLASAARRGAIWVRPDLVCEVAFGSITRDGILRHASFQGLREDKPARTIGRERSRKAPPQAPAKNPTRVEAKSANQVAGITITHPDRLVFADIGVTKLALAQYYAAVGDWILPEIANRPLSLLRCPEGIGGDCFFQKHFSTGVRSLERVAIAEHHGTGEYVVVRELRDLIALVQEGVVEIHPWGACADDPEQPDRLIFDLDPAPDIEFPTVMAAAREVRALLERAGLASFVKTTGGKGLHVVAPLRRKLSWPPIKAFARGVADALVAARPASYTANPLKRERAGKIFVDYLRNDRGATAVAAYSVRARPGAPVAMPVAWDELTRTFNPARYTLATVPKRLAARRADPWRDIGGLARALPAELVKSLGAGA